jgi:hypothetical protein
MTPTAMPAASTVCENALLTHGPARLSTALDTRLATAPDHNASLAAVDQVFGALSFRLRRMNSLIFRESYRVHA